MPDNSLPYRLYSYSNCRTTKLMFALIANVAKSTNDLYFMNRFHIRVLIMFEFNFNVGARVKIKHIH